MLDEGAEVFYPNPMWIRRDRLHEYVDPYIQDGLVKHGLKGATPLLLMCSLYVEIACMSMLIPISKMAS
jgi:hypothetical protein